MLIIVIKMKYSFVGLFFIISLTLLLGCGGSSGGGDGDGDANTVTYYSDSDRDGYGNPAVSTNAESQPSGYVLNNADCDDNDASTNPGATEICNDSKDNDCDGDFDVTDSDCSGGGEVTTAEVTVDPMGGEYFLSNGIILRIPEGAVNDNTTLTFRLVEEDEVMPVLNSYGLTEKHFMAAFEAEPYGFRFNKPIDIILPSEPRIDSTTLPYLFKVNLTQNIYTMSTVDSTGNPPVGNAVIMESLINKFLIYDCQSNTITLGNLEELPTDDFLSVYAQIQNLLEHSDCIADPCRCCQILASEGASDDIVDGECYNANVQGYVEFIECPEPTREDWSFEEKSIGSIEFVSNPTRIKVGESASVSTIVKDAEGKHNTGYSLKSVESSNPFWADIVSFGADFFIVNGVSGGQVTVTANFGCDIKDQMTVIVEEISFIVDMDSVTVPEGETASFKVKLSAEPVSTIIATVSRVSGDTDITVQSGAILTFDSGNWDSFKTVTLAAAEDADDVNGTATIGIRSADIDDKNITANEEESSAMNATWHMTPLLQYEQCRYVFEGSEWEEQDGFSSFDLRTRQPHGKDSTYIEANYDPITSLVFTGDWDSTSGAFSLSVDTANINECGYLLVATDTCGDAIDCTLVSCQNTTGLSGSTSENLDTLQAESTWYYSVTFSFYQGSGLPLGQNTWECEGTATFQGERQ